MTELKQATIEQATVALDSQGYWLWKTYLKQEECLEVLNTLSGISLVHNKKGSKLGECDSHPNLIELGNDLFRIALEPRLNQFVRAYFQRDTYGDEFPYQLARLQFRNLIGPCEQQHLHLDSRLPGVWPCISLHCFLYLSDVGPQDGPTEVVPGSHRLQRYPQESDRSNCIPILACKGDLMVLHSSLWHASASKTSCSSRPIIALAFNRWWMRQQFLFPYSDHLSRQDDLSEEERMILGFYNYPPLSYKTRISSRGDLPMIASDRDQ
jgi:hypothetical protein